MTHGTPSADTPPKSKKAVFSRIFSSAKKVVNPSADKQERSLSSGVAAVFVEHGKLPVATTHIPTGGVDSMPVPNRVEPRVLRPDIFFENFTPSVVNTAPLPTIGSRIEDTSQLVLCASLVASPTLTSSPSSSPLPSPPSSSSSTPFMFPEPSRSERTNSQREWIRRMDSRPFEVVHLHQQTYRMVDIFISKPTKDFASIQEVVILGPILDKKHFQSLLRCFMGEFDKNGILDTELLQGLVQLVQDAPSGFLQSDDMIQILRIIRQRLEDPAQQSYENSSHLVMAASRVLNVMADNKVKDLDREFDHEPLCKALSKLQGSKDVFLQYQALYALQALEWVPDNESAVQCSLRHCAVMVRGLLKMSGVVNLDISGIPDGLPDVISGGRGIFNSLKDALGHGAKSPWYLAIRASEVLIREGLFADLNKFVCEDPCREEPLFQWGVCQLLCKIAVDPSWDATIRCQATDFLGEMHQSNFYSAKQKDFGEGVLVLLTHIAILPVDDLTGSRGNKLVNLQATMKIQKLGTGGAFLYPHLLSSRLPLPRSSFLLREVNNTPDLELHLDRLRIERLEGYRKPAVYIPPLSKQSLQATGDSLVPLHERVDGFLEGKGEVMLILGDSGAGKSMFNMQLEHDLWMKYQPGGWIPLLIDLKAVDRPDKDLIQQHLTDNNLFDANQIEELKRSRQFILICDGYDECRKMSNLHTNNRLNRPRQWKAKMMISCRSQYLGPNYRSYFEPKADDSYQQTRPGLNDLFEEAAIVPFKMDQIKAYLDQYTAATEIQEIFGSRKVWSTAQYLEQLGRVTQLMDLVTNPFLLRLMLDTLPRVAGSSRDLSAIRMTRVRLYDEFVMQNFRHERERLSEQRSKDKMSPAELEALETVEDDFIHNGIDFSKRLAACIFSEQNGVNAVEYSTMADKRTWKAEFFSSEADVKLLRESSQLARKKNVYGFIHRSLLEYFFTCTVFEPKESLYEADGSRDDSPYLGLLDSLSGASDIVSHPFGRLNLVAEPSILHFLAERVQQSDEFKEQLHAIILSSKSDVSFSQAASNAITILVRAGVTFNGADLRGIQIPGADLTGGYFDSAQLQNTTLTKANFTRTWLRQADFSGASMSDVWFGEKPFFDLTDLRFCRSSFDGSLMAMGLHKGEVGVYSSADWRRIWTFGASTEKTKVLAWSFSRDNSQIASGSSDRVIRIWNLQSGELYRTLEGHAGKVRSVEFSPDGLRIASASEDGTIRIWHKDTGMVASIMGDQVQKVKCLAWSPDGLRVAAGSKESTVRIWNVTTGEMEKELDAKSRVVDTVSYSPDGQTLAAGCGYEVQLWKVGTNENSIVLTGHTLRVKDLAFSRDGQRVATCSNDQSVRLWDRQTGSLLTVWNGHTHHVIHVMFLNDLEVASASWDGTVRFWQLSGDLSRQQSVASGTSLASRGHTHKVNCVKYSPNGDSILSASMDLRVRQWDANTGGSKLITDLVQGNQTNMLTFSPDSQQIAVAMVAPTGGWRFFDLDHGGMAIPSSSGLSRTGNCVSYSPCGRWVASGGADGQGRLWDRLHLSTADESERLLIGHTSVISRMAFSPNVHSPLLASASRDHTIRLWDLETLECMDTLDCITAAFSFSSCGTMMAIGDFDGIVRIRDLKAKEFLFVLDEGLKLIVRSIAWSPCGQWIAVGAVDRSVRLWRIQSASLPSTSSPKLSGYCEYILKAFVDPVVSIDWHPDSKLLEFVTGSLDRSVCVWRLIEGMHGDARVVLVWGSTDWLVSSGARITDAIGLDKMQRKLLQQGNAIDESNLMQGDGEQKDTNADNIDEVDS